MKFVSRQYFLAHETYINKWEFYKTDYLSTPFRSSIWLRAYIPISVKSKENKAQK